MQGKIEIVVVVKRDCPTCVVVVPALAQLVAELKRGSLQIYSQDDPSFPESLGGALDDTSLERSFGLDIEVVPTLLRIQDGVEVERTIGWDRGEWERLCGVHKLAPDIDGFQPGCGSLSQEPGMPERLALRFGALTLQSRPVSFGDEDDPVEMAYDFGWCDGLPIVPPTDLRVARMLGGTQRSATEIVGLIPPNLAQCTVEKVAINAVMAGCRPEYLPVVLAVVEAALQPEFSMHGLLCTLWFAGPVVIVNGPIARRIGMNSQGNAMGQGNRANATIGRALQLIIRNVGGGRPQEIDRSVLGNPGKFTFCFAEDESDADWTPLSVARGCARGANAVTLFHGDGVQGVSARRSRSADELARSLGLALCAVCHPKLAEWSNAVLVLSPDHYAIFQAAGWGRAQIEAALVKATTRPGHELIEGAGGIAEGIDPARANEQVPKFNPGGLLVVRAGGQGGLMSAVIGGWAAARRADEVRPVTRKIEGLSDEK